ncbi:MAG: endonuclease Q family protein [Patescibacteria group bacterium]|nr:endonuclease Q family protein [Patescibacteria group bacterium]
MPEIITDLHLHSKYSRAVSQDMDLAHIAEWAVKKGIAVVGTSDFTHPEWYQELVKRLERQKNGLYRLKGSDNPTFFIPVTELSCIYSQGGRGHRIHIVIIAPDLETVDKIRGGLGWQGNLKSDGRPILGLSAIELTKVIFNASPECLVIPAHIWTPWFSLFGSESGFDSLTECFGEFADRIPAIETGLSSDPPMNWRLSQLDSKQIVSFSDAHSAANLGREATVFELEELSFKNIAQALKSPGEKNRIAYTIEFYPEEGKYHWDGHRNCGIRFSPSETKQHNSLCPKCGRRLTVGVMSRVEKLADRPEGFKPTTPSSDGAGRPPFKSLVPLAEIIGDALGVGKGSKSVMAEYDRLVQAGKSEFNILLNVEPSKLQAMTQPRIVEAIQRVREGKLHIAPGYDGEFGTVKIFNEQEQKAPTGQNSLF